MDTASTCRCAVLTPGQLPAPASTIRGRSADGKHAMSEPDLSLARRRRDRPRTGGSRSARWPSRRRSGSCRPTSTARSSSSTSAGERSPASPTLSRSRLRWWSTPSIPTTGSGWSKVFVEAHRDLESFEAEARILRPDGTVRHRPDPGLPGARRRTGPSSATSAPLLDITAYLEATERAAPARSATATSSPRRRWARSCTRSTGIMVEINRSGAALLGYEPDELLGAQARPTSSSPRTSHSSGAACRASSRASVESVQLEHRLLHRDGHDVWVDNNITIERSPDGEPLHFHALTIDITERKAGRGRAAPQRGPLPQAHRRRAGRSAHQPARRRAGRGQPRLPRDDGRHPRGAARPRSDRPAAPRRRPSPTRSRCGACCAARSRPSSASDASSAPTAARCG